MADNSIMNNIAAVEQYGKNLQNINLQMMQIFQKMREQTQAVGSAWKDDAYTHFSQDFDQDVMKKVQEISAKLELFSKYVEKQCEIHRMAQQNKYY